MLITGIYQIFAETTAAVAWACGPGCATCCTRSVTLTTGEGRLLLAHLREQGRALPELPGDPVPLRPALTTNGLAARYLSGREVEAEAESPWLFEPCFFLEKGLCGVYAARPFACRSFASTVNCGHSGMAEAPEWLITLSIVTNQLLESLDQGGRWGNLADVMAFLAAGEEGEIKGAASARLLPNRPSPGLLVSPGERRLVENYLARIAALAGRALVGMEFR